jgi:hypothetical protein
MLRLDNSIEMRVVPHPQLLATAAVSLAQQQLQ